MKLILDTDIDTDCDDAGALAVLHALMKKRGAIEVLGVICSVPAPWCATCVQAINSWYGRDDIRVGAIQAPDWDTSPAYAAYRQHRAEATGQGVRMLYNEIVGRDRVNRSPQVQPPGAVELYRETLARQPDASVTICAIGTLTALAQLLRSKPDGITPMSGRDLVARKVKKLVTMAVAAFPEGKDTFNWAMDLASAKTVLQSWPTRVVVSEHGETVLTGARFMAKAPADHPVNIAYRTLLGSTTANRPSWDQLAVLYAVSGPDDLFEEQGGYAISLDAQTGAHQWRPDPTWPDRCRLRPVVSDPVLAERVEDLMIESLGAR